ncbi:hypothetical protein NDU88_004833 [Pleurodeles waltl]|uniref:Uncharacterized protein n=1 Tax=Pleurodeles waltl TaxID=8319 RepID=A0AAV7N2L1_PLEWA|nr:hypothetical protein NDU88_004833 [Pleurodeles waltl]
MARKACKETITARKAEIREKAWEVLRSPSALKDSGDFYQVVNSPNLSVDEKPNVEKIISVKDWADYFTKIFGPSRQTTIMAVEVEVLHDLKAVIVFSISIEVSDVILDIKSSPKDKTPGADRILSDC